MSSNGEELAAGRFNKQAGSTDLDRDDHAAIQTVRFVLERIGNLLAHGNRVGGKTLAWYLALRFITYPVTSMRIFLSYRQNDEPAAAGRICDRLIERYGEKNVFKDVDTIPIAAKFKDIIRKELDRCDVLLAIIGPQWLGAGDPPRIFDPDDYVRFEIATALQRGIPCTAVLVEGAPTLRKEQLPDDLQPLLEYHWAEVDSGRSFRADVAELIGDLDKLLWTRKGLRKFWFAQSGIVWKIAWLVLFFGILSFMNNFFR